MATPLICEIRNHSAREDARIRARARADGLLPQGTALTYVYGCTLMREVQSATAADRLNI
eukprot:3490798-Pyramimonas_sp.AAC.2